MQVVVLGPQCLPTSALCRTLLDRCASSALLSTFIELSSKALLKDVDGLQHADLDACPPRSAFQSFTAMSRYHEETGYTNASMNGAIVAAVNIGLILEGLDRDDAIISEDEDQVYAGYCTGVLSALSIACSGLDQPIEIINNGVEAVRLAFFVGLRGQQAAKQFHDPLATPSELCWSIGVSGADYESVHEWTATFNKLHQLDDMSMLCVSAVTAASNVTVSGPPEYLEEFVKYHQGPAAAKAGLSFTPFHIYSSYHATTRGLQIKQAVLRDIEEKQIRFDDIGEPKFPVISSKDGKLLRATPQSSILDQALDLMLIDVCRWDVLSKSVVKHISSTCGSKPVNIVASAFSTALARDMCGQMRKTIKGQTPTVIDLSNTSTNSQDAEQCKTISPHVSDEIVVVSMACRFPGGVDTPEKFWDLLNSGKSAIDEIPKTRFDIDKYYGTGNNQTEVRHMASVANPEMFDCRLFNISPKEAEQKDPGHRMMAMTCYEALEQAGYVPNVCPTFDTKRIGCFLGASSDDYRENASSAIGSYFITGNIRAFVPGAISYNNKWEGPSNSIDTGDSSSTVAIEHAINALRAHQCDSALAGGVTFLTQPQMFIGMDKDGLLSHTGQNRTFCVGNDGAVRGDGVGVLLLKRLSDAVAEKDNIIATIAEAGTSFCASMTDSEALKDVFQQTCRKAGVKLDDVVHVEASGHHSVEGERSELQAIVESFGISKTISVGSVRPNIGACEAASGVASVIKSILMLQHGKVPAALHSKPEDLIAEARQWVEGGRLQLSRQQCDLEPSGLSENATILVSNRSLQRQNTVILVKKAPTVPKPVGRLQDARVNYPFVLTGKTAKGLEQTKQRYIDWLSRASEKPSLSDLSVTMTVRRLAHPFRICFSASSVEEVISGLKAAESFEQPKTAPTLGFMLEATVPNAGFDALLKTWPALGDAVGRIKSAQHSLGIAESAPLDAFIAQLSVTEQLVRCGLRPSVLASQGVGVLAALVTSGSLDLHEALLILDSKDTRGSKAPRLNRTIGIPILLSVGATLAADAELHSVWDSVVKELSSGSGSVATSDVANEWISVATLTQVDEGSPWKTGNDAILGLYRRGAPVSWMSYHSDFVDAGKLVITPTYAFDSSPYWMEYQDRNLIQTPMQIDESGEEGSTEEISEDEYEEESVFDGLEAPRLPLLSTCKKFEFDQEQGLIDAVYETSMNSEPAFTLVRGHLVHGRGLVPATMWAEMALEVGHDLDWRTGDASQGKNTYDVRDLTIFNSLSILNDDPESFRDLHIVVETKGSLFQPQGLTVTFKSRKGEGKLTDHLGCTVHRASEADWRTGWKKVQHLVQDRVSSIKEASSALGTRTAYRVFEVVVSYSKAYQGMKTVHLQHNTFEATTLAVQDASAPSDGFIVNPCLMDSLGQITGFISNVAAEEKGSVFIANSIESMRFTNKFREVAAVPGYQFRTYCKMSPVNDFMVGNMLVLNFEATEVIACMNGVRFRRVPLRVLQIMLPHASKAVPKIHATPPSEPVSPLTTTFAPAVKAQASVRPQPRPQQIVAAALVPATSKLWTSILDTIAGELGVDVDELKSDTSFADMGLDSLMSMVIIGSLRNILPSEIDMPNTLFLDHDTPAQLEAWLNSVAPASPVSAASRGSVASIASTMSTASTSKFSNATESSNISSATSVSGDSADQADMPAKPDATAVAVQTSGGGGSRARQALEDTIEVLTCELGVDRSELTLDVELSSLGLDSLMSLVVIGTLQERLPFKLPSNAFLENDSLKDLLSLYCQLEEEEFGAVAAPAASAPAAPEPKALEQSLNKVLESKQMTVKKPTLLQPGSDHLPAMFLAPEGSGSAAVYTTLPKLGRKVWGLNSPFYKNSAAWTGGMDQLAKYYLESMKMVQPKGPYILGGWSFGGIISYEMGRLLSLSPDPSDRATHLIMFDSPSPTRYPALPISVTDWLFKSDVFKGITPPQLSPEMIEHFRQTVDGLGEYKPTKYTVADKTPKAFIISAVEGLGKVEGVKEKCSTVDWLLESRASLGAGGWDDLIPNIKPMTIQANHFDMIQKPKVELLGKAIVDAIQA
ncbi:polyketide beta-ketoacyl-synthase [Thecaphora frezii]